MTVMNNVYQNIQKEIPLLINRPHDTTGYTASRINRRVNRFLEIRTVEMTNIIAINVKRQIVKRISQLLGEITRTKH